MCVCVCLPHHILPKHDFNTLCVPSGELIDLVQSRTADRSPIDPMRRAGCMHHHMQIAVVGILLPAHSYIVLCATWQVLDGKVALGRHTEMNDILLDRAESDDHYQTFGLASVGEICPSSNFSARRLQPVCGEDLARFDRAQIPRSSAVKVFGLLPGSSFINFLPDCLYE